MDRVDIDAEVLVGVTVVPRAAAHAALLLGWAVGAKRSGGSSFCGVAPDTSPRFYCIPKAGIEVLSLPLAIVRAADDGADVVVCATYVEGLTSPLLDDALEFAARLGRGGKGTVVVFPTGREMSSPANSVHSSLSLGMGDPASDPRVFCAGPSSRDGGWFLWRNRRGQLRPFANRGPAVRWLAPGDDMANPFAEDDRPGHAESSGASAIAAGILLLLIGSNPELELAEIDAILVATSSPVDPARQSADAGLADRRDLLPLGTDADRHNAKHGYGKLDATAACMASRDPVALAILRIGESDAALRYLRATRERLGYSDGLARWAVRVAMRDACVLHALTSLVRAIRLECRDAERAQTQPPGHLIRHFGLIVRLLLQAEPTLAVASELRDLDRAIRTCLETDAQKTEFDVLRSAAKLLQLAEVSEPIADSAREERPSGTRSAKIELRASRIADLSGSRS